MSTVSIVKGEAPLDKEKIFTLVKEAIDYVGGIETYVKKGDVVVIKPNVFAPYPPPVTTDRRVMASLVSLARGAGAKRVIVAEGCSYGTQVRRGIRGEILSAGKLMRRLRIEEAVKEAGGEVLDLIEDERASVEVPGGKVLHKIAYSKTILNCDVFINVPIMKTHAQFDVAVTLAIKNLQGLLTDYDKYWGHRDDFPQHIVDVHKVRKPDLNIIDALLAMEGEGSGEHGIPVEMNLILASKDAVAIDAVACAVMGIEDPLDVTTTRLGQFEGLGVGDISKIVVKGNTIEEVKKKFKLPRGWLKTDSRYLLGIYPNADIYIGGACPWCWGIAGMAAGAVSKSPERFSIIVGVDPHVPEKLRSKPEHTVILGTCAVSATRQTTMTWLVQERMRRHDDIGFIVPDCPPFEPFFINLQEYLIKIGLVTREDIEKGKEATIKRFDEYYEKMDPTWSRLEE